MVWFIMIHARIHPVIKILSYKKDRKSFTSCATIRVLSRPFSMIYCEKKQIFKHII
jgi:hypothetical protein